MVNTSIGNKCGGIASKTRREISPYDQARIVKEEMWEAFRWNLCEFTEDECENYGQKKRLKNKPSGAKNGLFVLGKKVPAYKKVQKVAEFPDSGKVKPCPPTGWFNYCYFLRIDTMIGLQLEFILKIASAILKSLSTLIFTPCSLSIGQSPILP